MKCQRCGCDCMGDHDGHCIDCVIAGGLTYRSEPCPETPEVVKLIFVVVAVIGFAFWIMIQGN